SSLNRLFDGRPLLRSEIFVERSFLLGNERTVSFGIDERVCAGPLFATLVLLDHAVIGAMSAEEYVARQSLEDLARVVEVAGDFGIDIVVNQPVAGIHVRAADNHDIVGLSTALTAPRPSGTAACMAGGEVGDQCDAAKLEFLAVFQDVVDFAGLP